MASRWGHDRARYLLLHGPEPAKKEVPTIKSFAPRFIEDYARANRHKPSGIAAKETILDRHLVPFLGAHKLDEIRNEDVQQLKQRLANKAAKTVNNVLTVLSVMLKVAVEWGVIERLPCSIRLLPVERKEAGFFDLQEFERLVEAARSIDPRTHLLVLLGGDAGLRVGWEAGIRTPITASRAPCPTVERPPSIRPRNSAGQEPPIVSAASGQGQDRNKPAGQRGRPLGRASRAELR